MIRWHKRRGAAVGEGGLPKRASPPQAGRVGVSEKIRRTVTELLWSAIGSYIQFKRNRMGPRRFVRGSRFFACSL